MAVLGSLIRGTKAQPYAIFPLPMRDIATPLQMEAEASLSAKMTLPQASH
jgi:hypothetical protein